MGLVAFAFYLLGDGARMAYAAYYLYLDTSPFLVILFGSLISLIFSLFSSRQKNTTNQTTDHNQTKKKILLYGLLNLSTIINWFSAYLSLSFLAPSAVSMLAVSIGPFILSLRKRTQSGALGILIASAAVLTALSTIFNKPGLPTYLNALTNTSAIFGTTLALMCGLSIYTSTLLSGKLSNLNQSPLKINTFKTMLLLSVSAVICYHKDLFPLSSDKIIDILIFALAFVFLTQLALQYAIRALGIEPITIGLSLAPSAALLVTVIISNDNTNISYTFTTIINSILLMCFGLYYYRNRDL